MIPYLDPVDCSLQFGLSNQNAYFMPQPLCCCAPILYLYLLLFFFFSMPLNWKMEKFDFFWYHQIRRFPLGVPQKVSQGIILL